MDESIPSSPVIENQEFDLKKVHTLFDQCLKEQLDLQAYIDGYAELNKLFGKLGTLFKFIVHDITEKTHILSEHLKSPSSEHYAKIERMLDYEKDNDLLIDPFKHPVPPLANGARTLLRLHRALLFVVKLIEGTKNSGENDKMAPLAKIAYDTTLANFHPWLIRKGVHLAVYTLPYRKQLIADLAGLQLTEQEANKIMELTVNTGQAVYDAVQKLYSDRNLLELP